LSGQGKKALPAFLRMEQITAEARAEGSDFGEIKRRIDGKGIVIFILESCGTIRDTGKKVFYSVHDSKEEHVPRSMPQKSGASVWLWKKAVSCFSRNGI